MVRVSTTRKQNGHDCEVAVRPTGEARLMHCCPQRAVAVRVRPVRVGPGTEEQLDYFLVTVLGSHVQWRGTLIAECIRVGSSRQFPDDGVAVAQRSGAPEGWPARAGEHDSPHVF
jgi:hypothetical protein